MPLYLYECVDHGAFEQMHSVSVCGNPQQCPTCGRMSPRTFVPVQVVSDTSLFTSDRLGKVEGAVDGSLIGDHYLAQARQAGVNVAGKQYMSQLARYPGDPEAWVGERADIVRVAKKRNLAVDGIVKVKNEPAPRPEKGLSERIVNERAKRMMQMDPGLSREKAIAQVIDKYAPADGKRIIKKAQKPKVKLAPIPKVGRHARGKLQS